MPNSPRPKIASVEPEGKGWRITLDCGTVCCVVGIPAGKIDSYGRPEWYAPPTEAEARAYVERGIAAMWRSYTAAPRKADSPDARAFRERVKAGDRRFLICPPGPHAGPHSFSYAPKEK